ncbi:2',3'-cyclic-nucleotide 2'-phosphodiesterase/5'-or 3'-nucleotidase, 5'-nucleotidase family [Evansella caseinilytica]|uniref:2',3'-cyclic-nucleotide 2'-phosphodiesterase/5'-or 3'-nucleotidase, 5'-nucleotidase family n=1 Tax=Evansella caseinilytica TaxID=1503961 RepID=A0A1H3UCP9_9BACI|nr:bifunctional UDP-sugar hydrolase/5'-nucleotidase [Evansella caseinilytica]SDZ60126.1 2',3'-cyclic-nucleotide 2'-phosphodiesterase/5'-or 3'-nucleotidase, 5'-nucleotidase family [Evansella caseinilytica]
MPKLRILHTNDLHSHLERWSSVAAWIKAKRAAAAADREDFLLVDIGDHADRAHPVTEALRGKGNVSLLNMLDYDAVTIGNNEGITFSKANLDAMYEQAGFSIIVSNLFHENGESSPWLKRAEILTTASGIRIGIIGVTVPYHLFYKTLGWNVTDPFTCVGELVGELRDQVDFLLCLSHLGLPDDERLAEQFPDVDLILGGHTHHVLPAGKKINDTWINQAGRNGKYVGDITVPFQTQRVGFSSGTPVIRTELVDLNIKDKAVDEKLAKLSQEAAAILNKKVASLSKEMKVNWSEPTLLTEMLAEGLREWCEAEISMVNAGVILDDLPAGEITYMDIHRICPHPINPATVMISGEQLLELIRQGQKREMVEFPLKGFGFRGKVLGALVFDGLTVTGAGRYIRAKDVLIHHRPLDKKRQYKLATVDMFTFGHIYPPISSIAEKVYYMPEFLRDVLAWKLAKAAGETGSG